MREKALLVGNDINNVTENYSWNDLINGLLDYSKVGRKVDVKTNKPFPLLYEEIYLNSVKAFNTPENRIKAYIASQTRKLKPNNIHQGILGLGIENIMTTNYDLSFESKSDLPKKKCVNKGVIKENLYNLFRFHKTENHKVWHIHGSETSPKTITLGYEHYSGYLQQMRNYTVNGTKGTYRTKEFKPLSVRLKENTEFGFSWVDFFFTHDIHIIGLNFDFVEMHLWWLLTYRSRALVENKIHIENKVYYYYPKEFEKASKNKLDMFKVNGVKVVPINGYTKAPMQYYNNIISKI